MTCGAVKTVQGGTTLVCNLEGPHEVHGVCVEGMPPFVRWPVPWTEDDEERRADRLQWRKGHVRRAYRTLAMWKAGR